MGASDALEAARKSSVEGLAKQPEWASLDPAQQTLLLGEHQLAPEKRPELGDANAVLRAVQARPLSSWGAEIDAVPARAAKALEAAVRLTAPKAGTVTVPAATLRSVDDIETYLADLRATLSRALAEHDTVVVKG